MVRFARLFVIVLAASSAAALAGCASSSESRADADATTAAVSAPPEAISCEKCETVWIKTPKKRVVGKGYTTVTYARHPAHVCPDCRDEAVRQLDSAQATAVASRHACLTCGGTLETCKVNEH